MMIRLMGGSKGRRQ